MTRLVNSVGDFPVEAVRGFALAHARYVQQVHGGVVRSTESPAGQVAVVLGGGSGHYPAFAGWVGPGMAHGAVCGNVFASPSASQVESVVRAADNGGGVLIGFGNYAGDVLHFGQAAERLRAEGMDVRIVTVTDDIASDTPANAAQRRGIAGDLLVFKIAGAAAEAGLDLDEVERVARRANAQTRSLGVAFGGCTLPGADHALFEVADGVMALGLGIHGEPGVSEAPLGTADEVADALLDGVLAEEPERGTDGYDGRVAVLVNGLGATKYEELFVVYQRIAKRLEELGLTAVDPEVGEHVTSLDMEGLSLTITFLDDELERYWTAPIDTPAFRRGAVTGRAPRTAVTQTAEAAAIVPGTPESQALAGRLVEAIRAMAACAVENEARLGDLDAIAGDGDHGQGMVLGTSGAASAAQAAQAAGAGARTLLVRAGAAWSEGAGGTSGALWGAALTAMGNALSDTDGADPDALVAGVHQAADAILRLGGATAGDKTMVDALVPFDETLAAERASGASLGDAWTAAAAAAATAAEATARIVARRGRARTHGEHSLGHPDPGATSFALLMAAVAAEIDPPTPESGDLS
ncbi:dihydroxyacetone kinase family protein [Cellulomonas sp. P24]|uniref:dihydroxyacetone kinase family protein n=1 Tax=Cellulomonas sp. P24 TaxID=2885206 RepID=UPI00216B5BAA|nr:dihydroxyacetone kinase family protein [Cellulomonas sp. P24]MCR6493687.1 dihydroxyacetone kinase family protein [Cellulomonas sp. P24]